MPKTITIEELKKKASKKDLLQFLEDHDRSQTCYHFKITVKQFERLIEAYRIKAVAETPNSDDRAYSSRNTYKDDMTNDISCETLVEEQKIADTDSSLKEDSICDEVNPIKVEISKREDELELLKARVEKYLTSNNISFVRDFNLSYESETYTFSFAVYKNEKLNMVIDCNSIYLPRKNNRQLFIPSCVKFMSIFSDDEFDDILRLYVMDYNQYAVEVFNHCRKNGFPLLKYDSEILHYYYDVLKETDINIDSIILQYHPSIWLSNKKNKVRPQDAWIFDKLLLDCILKGFIYWCSYRGIEDVLSGFDCSNVCPTIDIDNIQRDRNLIDKYLTNCNVVFDPFVGVSERLLASALCNKKFIGQDINPIIVEENKKLIADFGFDAVVSEKDARYGRGDYDALFTATPTYNLETYNMSVEHKTNDEWIDVCLNRYDCKKYLFIVKDTTKYKNKIVNKLITKTGTEYLILISK